MSWSSRKKKGGGLLYRFFCPKEIFLTFVFYLNAYCIEYTFRIYIILYISKNITSYTFLLVLKIRRKPIQSISSAELEIPWMENKRNYSITLLFCHS